MNNINMIALISVYIPLCHAKDFLEDNPLHYILTAVSLYLKDN